MIKVKLQVEKYQYTYLYKWKVKDPIAVLHLIHGSKEHIGRYEHMINYLNKQGIAVYGMDLRGHGISSIEQNVHGHIDSFKNIVNDINLVNSEIAKDYPNTKIVMYGHSMGSFILRYYLGINKNYDAILSGTNEQNLFSLYLGLLVVKLTRLFKGKKKINKFIDSKSYKAFEKQVKPGESWLSNDLNVVKTYENDKLNPKKFTNESFIAIFGWLKEIRKLKSYKNHKGKVLIISGLKDPVGHNGKGPKVVANKFKKQGTNVIIKLYKDGHHEIHNDKNKLSVYKDLAEFIKS